MGLSVGRTVRVLVVLAMLPALCLTQQAFVIHDHHGHDIHSHAITLSELDDWENDPEHRHDEHKHDGQPAVCRAEDSGTVVIVLQLPDAALRLRTMSRTAVVGAASAPPLLPIAIFANAPAHRRSSKEPSDSFPRNLCVDDTVNRILLTNHALLL